MFNFLFSLGSWWKVLKIGLFLVPLGFAWWNSSSADRLKTKLENSQNTVLELNNALSESYDLIESEREDADRLEIALANLEESREKVIRDRNNAWRETDKERKAKEAFLKSKNLTATEQDYVRCQPIPVPDSRKPNS